MYDGYQYLINSTNDNKIPSKDKQNHHTKIFSFTVQKMNAPSINSDHIIT